MKGQVFEDNCLVTKSERFIFPAWSVGVAKLLYNTDNFVTFYNSHVTEGFELVTLAILVVSEISSADQIILISYVNAIGRNYNPEFFPLQISQVLGIVCSTAVECMPAEQNSRVRGFKYCWLLGFFLLLLSPRSGS